MPPNTRTFEDRLESPENGKETSLIVRSVDSEIGLQGPIEEIGGTVRNISDDQYKVTITEERLTNLVDIEGIEHIEVEIQGGPLEGNQGSQFAMIQ